MHIIPWTTDTIAHYLDFTTKLVDFNSGPRARFEKKCSLDKRSTMNMVTVLISLQNSEVLSNMKLLDVGAHAMRVQVVLYKIKKNQKRNWVPTNTSTNKIRH